MHAVWSEAHTVHDMVRPNVLVQGRGEGREIFFGVGPTVLVDPLGDLVPKRDRHAVLDPVQHVQKRQDERHVRHDIKTRGEYAERANR